MVPSPSVVLGVASPRVIDVANSFATFAANGARAKPFMVKEVLGGVKIDKDIPLCRNCHDHKPMSWRTGVSAKTNKAWANFSCFACKDVIWYNLAPDGTWKAREGQ